ncbi:hypothetical protein MAR_018548 [Mya arenaria]|uniref:Uncharacterized protein n=1 Tax=Mya arenaria TaxID=6604 RepID=A0ABY7EHJ3_MYAAR|nr:hypothetical protein MAR_018548 [Mya arenaria]
MSVTSCTSPDIFVDMYKSQPEELDKLLSAISQERVKYQQWKRVKMQSGKERMRIVDIEMACQEFVDTMKKEFTEFVEHSGHGKSAYDGVGGTAKRNADMAVKQSKAVIQDANDFYAWAKCSQSEIEYLMVTQEEYDVSSKEIERRKKKIKPVKGIMKYRDDTPDLPAPQDAEIRSGDDEDKVEISVTDFAVAEYEGTCYIGQVLEIDNEDDSRSNI